MKQYKLFNDQRLDYMCSYCGDKHGTRDHVPSKILLDEPFPASLAVVPCCDKCNQSFSKDEEYFACAIECMKHGTSDPEKLTRPKIKRILSNKPKLRQLLQESFVVMDGEEYFRFDTDRFENVLTKLVKGHFKYETSQAKFLSPDKIWFKPLFAMSNDENKYFFEIPEVLKSPELGSRGYNKLVVLVQEIGSRAFFKQILNESPWETVQEDNYYYLVNDNHFAEVRIIIGNFLAVNAIWE